MDASMKLTRRQVRLKADLATVGPSTTPRSGRRASGTRAVAGTGRKALVMTISKGWNVRTITWNRRHDP